MRSLKAEPNVDLRMWNIMASLKARFNIDPEDVKPETKGKIERKLKRLTEERAEYYRISKG
jgi:hypothetical protein